MKPTLRPTSPVRSSALPAKLRDGIFVAAIVLMMALLLRSAVGAAGDRNRTCVDNMFPLRIAMASYVQDYDETFPAHMEDSIFVQNGLYPYLKTSRFFKCPATNGTPYAYNSQLSAVNMGAIPDPAATEEIKDAKAHPDGKFTVVFVDGRVERGGVVQTPTPPSNHPAQNCVGNVRTVALAIQMYVQDYDETFPVYNSSDDLEKAVLPYVGQANAYRFRCPVTRLQYSYSPALSGIAAAAIGVPSATEFMRDSVTHPVDRQITIGFADGHVIRRYP